MLSFWPDGIQRNRSMQISWGGCSEQALQVNLPCGGIEQVGSSDNVGDTLVPIVHNHGELIGEEAVGAQDHKIAAVILDILGLQTLYAIGERDRLVRRSDAPRLAAIFRETVATGPRIALVLRQRPCDYIRTDTRGRRCANFRKLDDRLLCERSDRAPRRPIEIRISPASQGCPRPLRAALLAYPHPPCGPATARRALARRDNWPWRLPAIRSAGVLLEREQTVLCNSTKQLQKYSIEGLRHTLLRDINDRNPCGGEQCLLHVLYSLSS